MGKIQCFPLCKFTQSKSSYQCSYFDLFTLECADIFAFKSPPQSLQLEREREREGKISPLLSSIVGSIWASAPPKVPHRRPCTLGIVIPMGEGRKRRREVSNLLSCQKSLSFLPPSRFISQPCSGASLPTHPYISIEAGHFLVLRCTCSLSPPLGKTIVWMASYVDGEG